MLLQARRHTKHLIFIRIIEGDNVLHLRLSVCQGSGLIKDDGFGLGNGLHKLSALDGNLVLSGFSHSGKNRYRHRKLQSTGEIYH